MSSARDLEGLETDRLVLRRQRAEDAVVFRQLWTERDVRVPAQRRIDSGGRPSVDDIVAQIAAETGTSGPRLLTVQRMDTAEVIGYCGLNAHGNGSPDEPEIAYELVGAAQGRGFATEAGRAVVAWADEVGYPRLWAGVWEWNAASRRVLEKLGFRSARSVQPHSPYGRNLLTVRENLYDASV